LRFERTSSGEVKVKMRRHGSIEIEIENQHGKHQQAA
jgi:hypothetical protein